MEHALIALAALAAAGLTFFSGFGLGTAMLPVFAVFFAPDVAVAATGVVHLVNNLLKVGLVRRHIDRPVVLRFGLPAIAAAFGGALLLGRLADLAPLAEYHIGARAFQIDPLMLVIAILLLAAGVQELTGSERFTVGPRALPVGGLVSGFLGGLAGLQGAMRSVFLLRVGLGAQAFIATGVAVGLLVDIARVGVYGSVGALGRGDVRLGLVAAGIAGASAGTLVANRFMHRVTIGWIRALVGTMLIVLACALGAGLV